MSLRFWNRKDVEISLEKYDYSARMLEIARSFCIGDFVFWGGCLVHNRKVLASISVLCLMPSVLVVSNLALASFYILAGIAQ